MRIFVLFLATVAFGLGAGERPFGIVVHGGAGSILRDKVTPEREKAYRKGLEAAIAAGYGVLEKGGSSLDAVEAAVRVLEDDPLFNAGKGAVLTAEGKAELDAAIMDGRTLAAGSVAGLTQVRNPVSLARRVMEKSPHVMLVGAGAEVFARLHQLEMVPGSYFITPERLSSWRKSQAGSPKGTVGAVALDRQGNLAAATSTGGMMNKKWGRVGDAPLIGVGTYANNATCAISCTGWGEYFIRVVVAHDISAQMAYKGTPLDQAAGLTLRKVKELGGDGGLIGLDATGAVVMPFNTPGMHRGFRLSDGRTGTAMFADEQPR